MGVYAAGKEGVAKKRGEAMNRNREFTGIDLLMVALLAFGAAILMSSIVLAVRCLVSGA